MSHDHHLPAGSTARDGFALDVDPERAGWTYSGLRVLELAAGEQATVETGGSETLVLPLSGACTVRCEGETFDAGRSRQRVLGRDRPGLPATGRLVHRRQRRWRPVRAAVGGV